jgi:nucleoside-diphosphate-sugar epimerase
MTVLVTGATGFVGSHVLAALSAAGHDCIATHRRAEPPAALPGVRWVRCDLLDTEAIDRLCCDSRADQLLHMGWRAIHSGVNDAMDNLDWLAASVRLARAFFESGGTHVLVTGSCFEYDPRSGRCIEGTTSLDSLLLYGECKNALRHMVNGIARLHAADVTWARIFFTYGPDEHPTRFVRSLVRSMLLGEPAAMSHGRQIRDFVYVRDVAQAIETMLRQRPAGEYNVASGQPVTLARIAEEVARQIGRPDLLQVGARKALAWEPPVFLGSVARTEQVCGWRATTTLADGLAETIEHERRLIGS